MTDHKPLMYALFFISTHHSTCTIHHLDFISQFIIDIQHIKGVDNSVANALSRSQANTMDKDAQAIINFTVTAAAQQSDLNIQKLQS